MLEPKRDSPQLQPKAKEEPRTTLPADAVPSQKHPSYISLWPSELEAEQGLPILFLRLSTRHEVLPKVCALHRRCNL